MRRALRLALKGQAWVLPNPMVGCVIVKDGKRIGEGFHEKFGGPHAEIQALNSCSESPKGATMFVTLEPCCHSGKTPPCSKAIIKSGISEVCVAVQDPSEKVDGKGVEELISAGIKVQIGRLEDPAKELNKAFFTFHTKKRPYFTLKAALSLDGMIAEERGKPTKLTGPKAQKHTHLLRHQHQAILVGAGTVLSDNPHLGVREVKGRDPLRVILKGSRELPKNSNIFRDGNVLVLEDLSANEVATELFDRGIQSVLIEGGQEIFSSFIEAKLVDKIHYIYAPTILGSEALSISKLNHGLSLSNCSVQQLGPDVMLTTTPQWDLSNG